MRAIAFILVAASSTFGCNLILGTEEGVLTTASVGGGGGSGGTGAAATVGGGGQGGAPECDVAEDCPSEINCEIPDCIDQVCVGAPAPAGTPCGESGALTCDDQGQCVGCAAAGECGTDTECATYACDGASICQTSFLDASTILVDPIDADCKTVVCSGDSPVPSITTDDSDTPESTECQVGACTSGDPGFSFVPTGTACPGGACDGAGTCGAATSCGDGRIQGAEQCDSPSFAGATCETLGFGPGSLACDATCLFDTSSCATPTCTDSIANGDETDTDCGGSCSGCAAGGNCSGNQDCASNLCLGTFTCQ